MKRLSEVLSRHGFTGESQTIIQAAAVLAATNQALAAQLRLTPDQAQATVYRDHQTIIQVVHGAIGGQINIHQKELLETINRTLNQRHPEWRLIINSLTTRVN